MTTASIDRCSMDSAHTTPVVLWLSSSGDISLSRITLRDSLVHGILHNVDVHTLSPILEMEAHPAILSL
jgi:hypothetical protein